MAGEVHNNRRVWVAAPHLPELVVQPGEVVVSIGPAEPPRTGDILIAEDGAEFVYEEPQ